MYSNKRELQQRSRRIAAFFTLALFGFFLFFGIALSYGLWWWRQSQQTAEFQYKIASMSRILSGDLAVESLSAQRRHEISRRLSLVIKNHSDRDVMKVIVDRFRIGFLESEIQHINFSDSPLRIRVEGTEYFAFKIPFIRNDSRYVAYITERVDTPSQFIYQDIVVLVPFVALVSFGLYFILIAFVRSTFRPVESVLDDLEAFVHNAGHELKTPLSVVDSGMQYLLATEEFDRRTVESARLEVTRMTEIIDGLIELASIQPTVEHDLIPIVPEIEAALLECESLIRAKHITINRRYNSRPTVEAPKKYIGMLLGNIVRNAVKYNRDGGTITIRCDYTNVTIADTGIGIPSRELERVFDRFFRAKQVCHSGFEGSGLGLSLAKKIVDTLGWNLVIASEEGVGTTVMVEFSSRSRTVAKSGKS
ncbi:MAG TPA: HAMP domain-containing sensor histidine kinase [bacterium]|nr:HAMP domain-containing sensor histidine kinase [bacterium]